jgi:nitroreductase
MYDARSRWAQPDHPVQDEIVRRWSPYVFAERSVSASDIRSLFEAARWAASSYNEQPWRYIVASKEEADEFSRVLSCLVEANQGWAQHAPVLAIAVITLNFTRNNKPNKAAFHDLGAASASLTFEATARGLTVHQMIGIVPERARELFSIPEGVEAVTALAIGYPGDPQNAEEKYRQRDAWPRTRKKLSEFVFGGTWGRASPLVT